MCSDSHRAFISFLVSLVPPAVIGLIILLTNIAAGDVAAVLVALLLLEWNVFALLYILLSVRTFSGADQQTFEARMKARETLEPRFWRRVNPRGDGPIYAIESSFVAFAVVLILPRINAISIDDWFLLPITTCILFTAWAFTIVSYALHYAEKDLAEPSFDFPGTRTNAFADYLYFSIAVATTFGATDVSITKPSMRRVVNLHTILTFVYNTVIVAMLAALLIR